MSRFPSPSLVVVALLSSLFIGSFALPDLLPEAEASSRDKRTIRKLKKQNRGLRKTVNSLRAQLTATRAQLPKPSIIEMVRVGNVGNVTDAGNTDEASVYGSVNYEYSIGKYEVSLAQYTRFLNAVAASDTYSLYNPSMATDLNNAGIERSGDVGSYTYAVIGSGNRPVTYVSWFDAARYCNWESTMNARQECRMPARRSEVPTRWTGQRAVDWTSRAIPEQSFGFQARMSGTKRRFMIRVSQQMEDLRGTTSTGCIRR